MTANCARHEFVQRALMAACMPDERRMQRPRLGEVHSAAARMHRVRELRERAAKMARGDG